MIVTMRVINYLFHLINFHFVLKEIIIIKDFRINLNFQSCFDFQLFHLNFQCLKKHLEDLNY